MRATVIDHVTHPTLGTIEINGVRILKNHLSRKAIVGVLDAQNDALVFFAQKEDNEIYFHMLMGFETGYGCDLSMLFYDLGASDMSKPASFSFTQCGVTNSPSWIGLMVQRDDEL